MHTCAAAYCKRAISGKRSAGTCMLVFSCGLHGVTDTPAYIQLGPSSLQLLALAQRLRTHLTCKAMPAEHTTTYNCHLTKLGGLFSYQHPTCSCTCRLWLLVRKCSILRGVCCCWCCICGSPCISYQVGLNTDHAARSCHNISNMPSTVSCVMVVIAVDTCNCLLMSKLRCIWKLNIGYQLFFSDTSASAHLF